MSRKTRTLMERFRNFLQSLGRVALPDIPPLPESKTNEWAARRIEEEQRDIEARLARLELQQRIGEGRFGDGERRRNE